MRSNTLYGLCLLWLGTAPVRAAEPAAFEQANQQFQKGEFAATAAAYEQILVTEGPRAAVYYNLGNSYQRLARYGHAILAYERARLLSPRDQDLLANLVLARKAATAFEEPGPQPRLDAALHYFSRNEWSWWVAASALCLGGLSLLRGLVAMPRRGWRQVTLAAAAVAGLTLIAGAAALYLRRDEAALGIILTDKAAVRLSPFEQAESLGTPGLGRSVRLCGASGDFRYVEVPGTSLHGWLAARDVAAIIPESAGSSSMQ
jgi:tetratricopeptide (TPR) repeat protein